MVEPVSSEAGPRVLVVDDSVVDRRLVVRALESIPGARVKEVSNGLAAREHLEREPVDVVISDLVMPGLDGLSLLRWARQSAPGPIWIILSGLDTFDAAVEAIHLGAFDFLQKPPNADKLVVSVRNALENHRLKEEEKRLQRELEGRVRDLEGLCGILEEQTRRIDDDLRRAETIQRALLPREPPPLEGFSLLSLYRPARHLGGDLYDVNLIDDRYAAFYVADASGHGVSAAMLSVLFKQKLCHQEVEGDEPLEPHHLLARVNRELHRDIEKPGLFVTVVYCLLDLRERRLHCASAGHPPILLVRSDGSVTEIPCTGPALGLTARQAYASARYELGPNDTILLYTDGLTDQPTGPPLERQRLAGDLSSAGEPSARLLEGWFREATADCGDERDDVTILTVSVGEGARSFDNRRAGAGLIPPQENNAATAIVSWGRQGTWTFLLVQGRGTYRQSGAFFDAAIKWIEEGRSLLVDLSLCDYLDSTFLGTVHALALQADAEGTEFRLQEVPAQIRALFEELHMDLVLDRITSTILLPPPAVEPLRPAERNGFPDYHLILWAHEVLASLADENREKFQEVLETLRRELGMS